MFDELTQSLVCGSNWRGLGNSYKYPMGAPWRRTMQFVESVGLAQTPVLPKQERGGVISSDASQVRRLKSKLRLPGQVKTPNVNWVP
jgi:hypothetical protein